MTNAAEDNRLRHTLQRQIMAGRAFRVRRKLFDIDPARGDHVTLRALEGLMFVLAVRKPRVPLQWRIGVESATRADERTRSNQNGKTERSQLDS